MKLAKMMAPVGAVLILGLGACASTMDSKNDSMTNASELEKMLAMSKEENSSLASQNQSLQQKVSMLSNKGSASGNAADLPPGAKPGECFARVLIPAKYESASEKVVASEASEKIKIIPAKYEFVKERVLVREASERLEVIPATYKTVTETIEIEPSRTELRPVAATYKTISEKILVEPAKTVWKKGTGPITKINAATGEIMCLVDIPARYETVTKRVQVSPASSKAITIPGKSQTVKRTVIDRPASTRAVTIPAQYKTVKVRKLVSPASEARTPIPATYKTVTKRQQVSPESLEWREILCKTNTTPNIIRRLQSKLKAAGHNPGPIDGVYGSDTRRAVTSYQRARGLPTGELTMRTIKTLGL